MQWKHLGLIGQEAQDPMVLDWQMEVVEAMTVEVEVMMGEQTDLMVGMMGCDDRYRPNLQPIGRI